MVDKAFYHVDYSPYNEWILAWRDDLKFWFVGRRCSKELPGGELIQRWETRNHNYVSVCNVKYWKYLPDNPENYKELAI